MTKVIISSRLKELRAQLGFTQEQIAQICNVTVQAVSKWECELSYPDIQLLPLLADTFHVTLDDLLCGVKLPGTFPKTEFSSEAIPDDDVLRVVQYHGRKLLDQQTYNLNVKIPLLLPEAGKDSTIHIEIWGSASVDGDISGNLTAGAGVDCGDIGNNAAAGAGINCGSIGNNATAGAGINCGNIGNNATAGTGINCGNIGSSASAGADVNCGNVCGDVNAGADVSCGDIGGSVEIGGDLECKNIAGDVHLGGDLHCEFIEGTVSKE